MNLGFQKLHDTNPGKYPARMGFFWGNDEVQQLLQNVKKRLSFDEIAEKHERTRGSITAKLRQMAADYYLNDERNIEDIKVFTGLTDEEILDAVQRRKISENNKEKKATLKIEKMKQSILPTQISETSNSEILSELKKISELLTELVQLQKTKLTSEATPKKILKVKPMFVEDD